ncbi:hypothetical protein F5878DRAFT_622504 [Lentinula raphanica]|uniref:Uncharacterized protein n=1 Tax=Lentinula raphanica TaxID=153919 RepID=A0AA38UD83_9AGAR|nr:hypothetical protein F5878DRAFT_622504 [Lentinula raphanica]
MSSISTRNCGLNFPYPHEGFIELLLDTCVAISDLEKTEQEAETHSKLLQICVEDLGSESLHGLKQEGLYSILNALETRKRDARECSQKHLNDLGLYTTEDIQEQTLRIKQAVEELDITIPSLREMVLARSKSTAFTDDPFYSKLAETSTNIRQLALQLGISVNPEPFSIGSLADRYLGRDSDDTAMDRFVDWDGGATHADLELANDFASSFPSHPQLKPCSSSFDSLTGDNAILPMHHTNSSAVAADSISTTSSHSTSGANSSVARETQSNLNPEMSEVKVITQLKCKRDQVSRLQKENENVKQTILELNNQIVTLKTLSGLRRQKLDRVKAQLKIMQSRVPAQQEWISAAQFVTENILNYQILPILSKMGEEIQDQAARTVRVMRTRRQNSESLV